MKPEGQHHHDDSTWTNEEGIETTGMELCSANKAPTSQTAFGSEPEGPPIKEAWKYSSVVGMLLYLSTNTRPDIAFAVSQVAQFNSNPKQSHASAVKMIIRYLSGTSDKASSSPLPLISRLIVMWMQTSLDYMEENLKTYLQCPLLYRIHYVLLVLPSHLEKSTSKQKLHSPPSMQNMLPSLQPSENSSPSNESSKNLYTSYTLPTQLLSSMLKVLKKRTQPISLL